MYSIVLYCKLNLNEDLRNELGIAYISITLLPLSIIKLVILKLSQQSTAFETELYKFDHVLNMILKKIFIQEKYFLVYTTRSIEGKYEGRLNSSFACYICIWQYTRFKKFVRQVDEGCQNVQSSYLFTSVVVFVFRRANVQ